ncbi:MAG: hypothetical protein JXB50_15465 [Spirochaetes bacterium]|nr:hypothetical protein [Spirochaetota bacterium]
MPYCSRCGIEVDNHVKNCPLCNAEIQHLDKIPAIPGIFPDDNLKTDDYYIPFEKKKKIIWSIFSFLLATALLIIFAVNFLLSKTITWAWIPLFSLLFAWGITAIIYYLYKKIFLFLLFIFILTSVYLFFLFLVIKLINLFILLAFPALIVIFTNIIIVFLLCKKAKKKGYNIIGFILSGSALLCIGIDIIISFFITSKIILTWSIVIVSLLLPFVLFFFYIHYILKWTPDINKIFHI